MPLKKKTLLQRAPDLEITLRSGSRIKLSLGGKEFPGNLHTLAILDTFVSPKSFKDGVKALADRVLSEYAWTELTNEIKSLYDLGILRDSEQQRPTLTSSPGKFDGSSVHIRMLEDYRRTADFQQAIRETVTADDIVLDMGTGTGVLAVTAARAGAKHVFAVEESGIATSAAQVFARNGLTDKITLIEARSTQIELPERASVLVSEIVGNDPLQEGILEKTSDAVRRLLKPDARLIPAKLRIFGLPITVPHKRRSKCVFTEELADKWKKQYEIDFTPLVEIARQQDHHTLINSYSAREWDCLSDPVFLADINLKAARLEQIETNLTAEITNTGILSGILIYFELDLTKTVSFSIRPDLATPENSWASMVWLPGDPLSVEAGETIGINYRFIENRSRFEVKKITDRWS